MITADDMAHQVEQALSNDGEFEVTRIVSDLIAFHGRADIAEIPSGLFWAVCLSHDQSPDATSVEVWRAFTSVWLAATRLGLPVESWELQPRGEGASWKLTGEHVPRLLFNTLGKTDRDALAILTGVGATFDALRAYQIARGWTLATPLS